MSVGESMRARWGSCAAGESVVRVVGELFVVARGPGAAAAVDTLTEGGLDPASRSALASPPVDPLASLLSLVETSSLSLAGLRLTPPWAAVALIGDASLAHGSGDQVRRLEGTSLRPGELEVRYLRLAPGDRLVLSTGALEVIEPSEEACRRLAGAHDGTLAIRLRER